ncbi:MAG: endolytic transglycosylase MltG, partial [Candidatus Saccharibacteria bacterium]
MLPPKRPTPPVAPQPDAKSSVVEPVQARPPTPLLLEEHTSLDIPKKRSYKKKLVVIFTILLALITVSLIGLFCWYQQELRPVSTDPKAARVSVVIETGATPSQISETLFQKKLIRSTTAFDIYTRLSKTQNRLQAGSYRLSPGESTQAIVDHLVSGKTDAFNMTFLPGATLAENRNVFLKAGFKDSEIDAAFKKTYDSPLFQDKPATADLEGYIFGDTYSVSDGNTVEEVLQRTFDEFYTNVQKYDLVTGFKAHGLNLYQGITLASIIQREVSREADEKQVAQVFYKRLQ